MNETRHVARLHGPLAPMIAHRPSTARPIEPPRDAYVWQDAVAMDWLHLRTMVDALLRRAAASKNAADAIAARSTTPLKPEAIHG